MRWLERSNEVRWEMVGRWARRYGRDFYLRL